MFKNIGLAAAIAVIVLGTHGIADAQTPSARACSDQWRGDVTMNGATWRIGVTRADDGAIVDVPSMWRANARAPQAFTRDRVSLDVPYELGRLTGRIVACRLVGEIVRKDGARGQVNWGATTRFAAEREELTFDVNGVTIAATLVRPSGVARAPLVIVLHGGGDSSRADSPPYTFWAEELAQLGFAALVYDKRGNGASTGHWREVGFDERAADVVAMARTLSERSDINADNIGLLAVSQGGWVAVRAAQMSVQIRFIAAISSPVVSPYEADTYASWRGSRNGGLSAAEADERIGLWRAYADYARSGASDTSWNALMMQVRAARERPWFARRPFDPGPRGDPREDPFVGWYQRVLDYDPRPALSALDIPMLWVYGAGDTQSDVAANVAELAQLRDRAGKPYSIAVLANGDHGVGVAAPDLHGEPGYFTAAPGFLDTVEGWLRERLDE